MNFSPSEIIKKKKLGGENSRDEIFWLIKNFTSGEVPDYQMSAWAMAVWFKGMTENEIANLTQAMRTSGTQFNFKKINGPRIDKHSTGGIGDKTSIIIGPILAAAGVHVPMIAGRGLGHTGGTLDKLDSIPGFRSNFSVSDYESLIFKHKFALLSQTEDVCPADKKLYALRDVTSTVDSLPLICGSIMSKKLAEDLTGLVLDVKFGSGAFMKSIDQAIALAGLLKSAGEKNGLQVTALITNMNEPLGRYFGNSVEIKECVDILSGKTCIEKIVTANGPEEVDFYSNTRELSLILSGHMLCLAKKANSPEAGYELAKNILNSGEALSAFNQFIEYQGPCTMSDLPEAKFSKYIVASKAGFIHSMNAEVLGVAAIELGAGRKKSSDKIDYSAGVECLCRVGMRVSVGQKLFRIFSNTEFNLRTAEPIILSALNISVEPVIEKIPLVAKVLL